MSKSSGDIFTDLGLPIPPKIVIANYLETHRAMVWNPIETAGEIIAALADAGLEIRLAQK